MTDKEIRIINLLEDIYEAYMELDVQHKDDKNEFINALHILQHLVMIRSVRRKYKKLFPIDTKSILSDDLKDIIEVKVKDALLKEGN